MYLLPIYLTFGSFLILSVFGKVIGRKGSLLISLTSILFANIVSFFIFYDICLTNNPCYIKCFTWINFLDIQIYWSVLYDTLTATMLLVVTTISLCAHIFSVDYMQTDPHQTRFFNYLSLFTFFMVFLITSSNMLQLFLGWEGVGITSYLLINFWYTRAQANKSSLLAVMANKLGDISLLIVCVYIHMLYKTLDFNTIWVSMNTLNSLYSEDYFVDEIWFTCLESTLFLGTEIYLKKMVCFLLVISAVGKSAQAGFHIWLAEAMEGPTPVSSLIHAATMVTAGVFLILRCSFFFETQPAMSIVILFWGSFTAFFAACIGLFQNDIKKVIAYSTCSQLGYMFMSCGLSGYSNSMYHLFNHAFFKALLFLTAGYLIHALSNEQDIRKMGGLLKVTPLGYIFFLVGSLSLMGFPFFSGFFSKDQIIELLFSRYSLNTNSLFFCEPVYISQLFGSLGMILTVIYSIRVLYYVFLHSYKGYRYSIIKLHHSTIFSTVPLFFLSIVSLTSGYYTSDMMTGLGTDFWGKSLVDVFFYDFALNFKNGLTQESFYLIDDINFILIKCEYDFYIKQLALAWTIYFIFVSLYFYIVYENVFYLLQLNRFNIFYIEYKQIKNKYIFINKLFVQRSVSFVYNIGYYWTYLVVDKGLIEFFGPFFVTRSVSKASKTINKTHSGLLYHYLGIILLVLILMINILFYNVL